MTLATMLSLSRGVAGLILPFMILSTSATVHVLAVVVFIVAAITDYFDGWVARKFGQESDLGKILDPTMDKVLFMVPFALFAFRGFYSVFWVILVFAREIAVTFCRIGWYLEGRAVGAEKLGKWKLVIQFTALGFAAAYLLCLDYGLQGGFASFVSIGMKFFVIISVVLTVLSGAAFMKNNSEKFKSEDFAKYVCALGVGLIPVIPGTWGSAAGLGLIALVHWNPYLYWGVFVFLFYIGYVAARRLKLNDDEDPGYVVIDEACGMFVTFVGVPLTPLSALIGFVLFRVFDIWKPFPVRRLENLHGYWGIMFDDLGAGVYACIALHLVLSLL